MTYIRERSDFPEKFTIHMKTQEEVNAFKAIAKTTMGLDYFNDSTGYWRAYGENTVYFIDGGSTTYGNKVTYVEGVKNSDSTYMGYVHYSSFENFLEGVSSLLFDEYEIY